MKHKICPVCSSKSIYNFLSAHHTHGKDKLQGKESFSYFKCLDCNALFIQDIVVDNKYYKTYYNFPEYIQKKGVFSKIEQILTNNSIRFKKNLLRTFLKRKNRKIKFLDIGCGKGEFLESLDKREFSAFGIELDNNEYSICKEKNLTVYNTDILHMNSKVTYDAVSLWHVIEHIKNPNKLFIKISSVLAKNGLLFVSTPNPSSIGFRISREKWFHLDAPRHLILYEEKSVEKLCKTHGFKIESIKSQTFEFPFDLFWSAKYSPFRVLIYVFYPILKYLDRETLVYVLKKSS